MHSVSAMSVTSWTSATSPKHSSFTRTDHRPSVSGALDHELDSYCPDLMASLLSGLSLLQSAVHSNRIVHYRPATAYIVSCVRTILSKTGCLSREALVLRRFGALSQERKRILSDLTALVSQTKKASEESDDEDQREIEVEAMLRLGGQVFAHVRRFLAVAVQCGIVVPDDNISVGSGTSSSGKKNEDNTLIEDDDEDEEEDTYKRRSPVAVRTTNGIVNRPLLPSRHTEPTTPRFAVRARSLNDIRSQRTHLNSRPGPPIPNARAQQGSLRKHDTSPSIIRKAQAPTNGHKGGFSISSVSSSSSFDSFESVKTPGTPRFPNGPCSVAEVMEALRHTHDQYLSTIAAFIGHAHSHSRTSHASSTGHMFELVKEVVEMVCRLLIIVEAVMTHPDIPPHKVANLKAAKQSLYNVTSSLAESVTVLTSGDAPEEKTEEGERVELLGYATRALKAGSDCVNEVKKCLTWSVGDKPIVIRLYRAGEAGAGAFSPRRVSGNARAGDTVIPKAKSLNGLGSHYDAMEMEEDAIQAQGIPPPPAPSSKMDSLSVEPVTPKYSPSSSDGRQSSCSIRSRESKALAPLVVDSDTVLEDLPSPLSFARTDDDGTTWEGSQLTERFSEDQNSQITLPPTPTLTSAARDMLSHNYSAEDVAYNKDGVLVGATLSCLVEKMTPHDNIVDAAFSAVFFLTFRMFSSASDLVEAIIARYNLEPPNGLTEEDLYVWQQRKGVPVRLRVANFLKLWLETYWRSATDDVALGSLMAFTRDALTVMFPHPSQRLMELIMLRSQQTDTIIGTRGDRVKDPGIPLNPPSASISGSVTDIPRPVMTKALLSSLRARNFGTISILDFDALELARQMTLMESKLYCAITAEEVLETGKEVPRDAPVLNVNVKAVTTLSTVITGWVAESILNEADAKKRTALVKFFIKLSDVSLLLPFCAIV
jgi:son of sevenless